MNSKTNKLPACSCRFTLALVLAVFTALPAYAANVTFGWDPNEEPDLEGYRVYHNAGSPGPPYKHNTTVSEAKLADPLHPMVKLTGLQESTKYFVAVTAYDSEGNESRYSDDICVQIVDSGIEVCSSSTGSGGSVSSGGSGGGSGGCFISAAGLQTDPPIAGSFSVRQPAFILFFVFFLLIFISARCFKAKI